MDGRTENLVLTLILMFLQITTAQVTDEGQCLSICAESWPDTKGPIGPPGPPGAPGISGPVGRQGQPGVLGPVGTQGIKGEPGEKGIKGDVGGKGEQGENGVKGQAGLPGKVGPQGSKGDSGNNGTNGVKGDTGEPGIKGQKGEEGEVQQVKVAFTVTRESRIIGTSAEQTITYTDVIVNQGANIDVNSGVFICEVPGIYYFSFTFRSYSGKYLYIRLKQNDSYKFAVYQTFQSVYNTHSQSGMLHLNQGDQVKLVMPAGTSYQAHYCTHCNVFNGFLVYPD
ncbi:complement C1q tumor necrosis factor-related protein 2-like [Ptychodera flava]|uniref:complement C1q tumor necrosis factor-related protein 2-like n=1 Tax=Ptychodera flava TaxID=63121 RepID=UPI00396A3EE6